MGGDKIKVKHSRIVERLVYLAGLSCLLVSFIYVLASFTPLMTFHGLVRGYYSLLDYNLVYTHSGQSIRLPHSDYARFVSLVFTALSMVLLVLSLISIALAMRRLFVSAGLIYGISLSQIVLYGLLNGYIYRVMSYDMSLLSVAARNGVVYRTLAGEIRFVDTSIDYAMLYQLVFNAPTLMILLVIATSASSIAVSSSLYVLHKQSKPERRSHSSRVLNQLINYTSISLTSLTLLASLFTYYPSSLVITPQPPPATLEPSPYVYTCTALARTTRGALAYTDFESYPLLGWATSGGIWSSVSGITGAKGNVLQGQDNGGGIGGASYYYHNTRLDNYTSLWVAVKARRVAGNDWFGISLINSGLNRVYVVGIEDDRREIEIRSFNVEAANTWVRLRQVRFTYIRGNWYLIVVNYVVTATSVNMMVWVYNEYGDFLISITATSISANRFTPAYIGVFVDNPTAQFDEFIVSTVDPRSMLFTEFMTDMRVEVWDNLGLLVNSTTAPASSFYLNTTSDVVVGTGVDGRIIARYLDAQLCGVLVVPMTDAILGGDTYALTTRSITLSQGANKTSADLTVYISGSALFNTTARILRVNTSQVLYARLLLNSVSPQVPLYLDIWLEGATRSTNISIVNGIPVLVSTSAVQLNNGLNNNITLTGYFGTVGLGTMLSISLELCTGPGNQGACVYYPLILVLVS